MRHGSSKRGAAAGLVALSLAGCQLFSGLNRLDTGELGGDGGGGQGPVETCNARSYVNRAATGAGDGTSWEDAFVTLSEALEHAQGCAALTEVWVAQGVYVPGASSNDSFALRDNLAIYGGFAGDESSLDERDWQGRPTILSGDVGGDDATDDGVVWAPADIVGENALHVIVADSSTKTAVLDGFTITGGHAAGVDEVGRGAGLLARGETPSPTLQNLAFVGNVAAVAGGGMAISGGAASLTDVSFSGNAGEDGGGLYVDGGEIELTRVTVGGNEASISGGGIVCAACTLTAAGVVVNDNRAGVHGGGLDQRGGASTWSQSQLRGNQASGSGGAIHLSEGGELSAESSLIAGNLANLGGGLHHASGTAALVNVTFGGNEAMAGGALYVVTSASAVELLNCIVFGNGAQATVEPPHSASIGYDDTAGTLARISYSIVEHSFPTADFNPELGVDGGNNLDADPDFANPLPSGQVPSAAGDYVVDAASAAVDKGNANLAALELDLAGNPRVQGSNIDIGAYEVQP